MQLLLGLLFATVLPVFSAPTYRRAATGLNILTKPTGSNADPNSFESQFGCTPDQVTAINNGVNDALSMTQAAITALSNPQVTKDPKFMYSQFLGTAAPADVLSKQVQPLSGKFSQAPALITTMNGVPDTDVTFICGPQKVQPDSKQPAVASTRNKGVTTVSPTDPIQLDANLIILRPQYFAASSLAAAKAALNSPDPKVMGALGSVQGMTLVHEVQHSIPIVGGARLRDLKAVDPRTKKEVRMYNLRQCTQVLSPAQKASNAQNIAWFPGPFQYVSRPIQRKDSPTPQIHLGTCMGDPQEESVLAASEQAEICTGEDTSQDVSGEDDVKNSFFLTGLRTYRELRAQGTHDASPLSGILFGGDQLHQWGTKEAAPTSKGVGWQQRTAIFLATQLSFQKHFMSGSLEIPASMKSCSISHQRYDERAGVRIDSRTAEVTKGNHSSMTRS
ncbi:hypothetical protein GLOTRDRAFT_94357 [Gloeophyllum trabeum ATCC 11539]|uniref:Lysine-specific metallo-endopeptidase domain-containing protein n=1 Tax=Gloeophyllum trabeum (strain ATCC 11539 / FP-39264 / Madison 617) TaxID=670483 RepID=S7Q378_GLOTA|nr:uncharacterized protein GLOTRDRAFT_94357 [Gloeophyllum trabeum ATCC 11539]EPQ53943.1 hypothetical protein GLOTRDRAFT_94357 [Gloeophyllum trabeum ATCC 11539]